MHASAPKLASHSLCTAEIGGIADCAEGPFTLLPMPDAAQVVPPWPRLRALTRAAACPQEVAGILRLEQLVLLMALVVMLALCNAQALHL